MPARREITVGGLRTSYVEHGSPDAPTVLAIHALGLDGGDWDAIGSRLARTRHLLAPDARGHGRSDWPGDYSFELMRDDVLAFADALALHDVTLVGHSMGGIVAWLVAAERPAWLTRLVIEDAPVPSAGTTTELRQRPEGDLPFDWAAIVAIVGQINAPDPDWWSALGAIDVPTLVVRGGSASTVPQDEVLACAAAVGADVVEIPVGHHIHRSRPDEFLAAWANGHSSQR